MAGLRRSIASSSAAHACSACSQSCSCADGLQSPGRLEGLRGPEVAHRPLEGVRRLLEPRGIPPGEGLADLRHALRAFVEEEPHQLLHQLHVPVHAIQGRVPIEDRGLGRRSVPPRRLGDGGRGQVLQGLEELLGPERLGDVAVHARRQAAFPVPLHGVGGHGDDRGMDAGARLAGPDRGGRLEPVHLRHLHVHQHRVERRAVVQGRRAPRGRCRRPRPDGPASPAG